MEIVGLVSLGAATCTVLVPCNGLVNQKTDFGEPKNRFGERQNLLWGKVGKPQYQLVHLSAPKVFGYPDKTKDSVSTRLPRDRPS